MNAQGVRARGASSIQIDFTVQGVRCRETLKIPPTKENLLFAARKKQAIQYEIAMGSFDYIKHFPNSVKAKQLASKDGSQLTVKLALSEWLKRKEKRCEFSTIRDYSSAITCHLNEEFGEYKLDEIKSSMINDWITSLDISNKRINNILTPLRQMFTDAYCDEVIDSNPMDRVRNLPKKTREPKPFSNHEIDQILSQLEGQSKNLIQFAFWSGLRTSELIGLRWEDVDLINEKVHIRRAIVRNKTKDTKTSSGRRTIELLPKAKQALDRQQAFTENTVFNDARYNTPTLDDQKIRKVIWKPALESAGITYREPYQTRHTFASMMLSQGKNPLWVASQMGHKDWGMIIKVYGRWINQESK